MNNIRYMLIIFFATIIALFILVDICIVVSKNSLKKHYKNIEIIRYIGDNKNISFIPKLKYFAKVTFGKNGMVSVKFANGKTYMYTYKDFHKNWEVIRRIEL